MTTITISLPDKIAKKIDEKAQEKGYASRSEYIRDMVRRNFEQDEIKFEQFQPIPLDQLEKELQQTGKYSRKFIKSVTRGFKESGLYGN